MKALKSIVIEDQECVEKSTIDNIFSLVDIKKEDKTNLVINIKKPQFTMNQIHQYDHVTGIMFCGMTKRQVWASSDKNYPDATESHCPTCLSKKSSVLKARAEEAVREVARVEAARVAKARCC